jgi:hypothetical protein
MAGQPAGGGQLARALHQVTVGSSDAAGPGDDANFSMVAMQAGDGTSSGQYTDQWKDGRGSIHVAVDCLHVVDNRAWVSGVVTSGTAGDVGMPIYAMVEDNGTSAHDAPDKISASYYTDGTIDCRSAIEVPLYPLFNGQVRVR